MELDELKSLLNDKMERVHREKSTGDLALLLGKKTQSVIGKLKRSLRLEIIACIIFTVACIAVAILAAYTSLRIYFGIFAAMCFLFFPLLYMLLRKTNELSSSALPVKSNLQTLVKLLNEYVKRYFQLTMILIPVSIIIAFLLGYSDENLHNPALSNPFFPNLEGSSLKTAIVIAYIILFSAGMYYFTKWYLKKLYGNYLKQLEQLIEELENME